MHNTVSCQDIIAMMFEGVQNCFDLLPAAHLVNNLRYCLSIYCCWCCSPLTRSERKNPSRNYMISKYRC